MKKPNVLLIYPDEMRYDSTSFAGNKLCKTPNIDALMAESTCFESAYTSFPLCCPFRSSLMTGKYAHNTGVYYNHYPIRLDQDFLPQMMKRNGYYTGWIGKWHLAGGDKYSHVPKEYQLGFDEFVGFTRGHQYLNSVYYRGDDKTAYKSKKYSYEPEYQTEQLLDFIDSSLEKEKPFLGMICYGLPHHPVHLQPEHYKNMYSPDDVELPDSVPDWLKDTSKEYRAMYYGMVSAVDDQMKRIIDYLKEKDLYDNTVLILVSDHGDMCDEFGIEDKVVCHEASCHVPFVIHYPELQPKGNIVNQIVDPTISIVPTILDLCGIEVPSYMPGKSLKNAMVNGSDDSLDSYSYYQVIKVPERVCEVFDPQDARLFPERGFRTKDFLYVEKCGVPFKCYDLQKDPNEYYNVVDNFKYLGKIREFSAQLKTIMKEVKDDWDITLYDFPNRDNYQSHGKAPASVQDLYANAVYEE